MNTLSRPVPSTTDPADHIYRTAATGRTEATTGRARPTADHTTAEAAATDSEETDMPTVTEMDPTEVLEEVGGE